MHHFWDLLTQWGPPGAFVIAGVDSLGVPNPGITDAVLILAAIASPANAMLCAILAIVGSLIGGAIFFEITRRGGERYLVRYTSSGRGLRFRAWFLRYGLVTVFIPALLPLPFLPLKFFAACAGAMGESRLKFLLVLAAGRIPRYFALVYLGATRWARNREPGSKRTYGRWACWRWCCSRFCITLMRLAERKAETA